MVKQPNEDLFEGSTMTFGEHLDELRGVLFRSLIGLLICVVIGFLIADQVVTKIQGPLRAALQKHYLERAKRDLFQKYDGEENTPPEMINLIVERGFIPEPAYLDIETLANRLRQELPDHFSTISFKTSQFALADFPAEDASGLCEAIASDKDDASKPASVLWGLMNAEERASVTKFGEEEMTDDDRRVLLRAMNRLIEDAKIHESQPFRDYAPKDSPAQAMITRHADEGINADDTRRLNRMLLAEAFHKYLAKPQPLVLETPLWKPISVRVQTLNAHEAFMIWLKAAFLAGLVMASPWIFFQIWSFVGAGLYPHERKYVYFYLPFSLLLFLAGASMAFFFVFQHVLNFLFGFNLMMDIDPDPRISEWLSFVLLLPVGFGIAFQLPLGMLFLYRLGIFSLEIYLAKWRLAILIIFVLSMLLTPADPISMLLMAVPLTALYFLGIVLCHWLPRTRSRFPEGTDPT